MIICKDCFADKELIAIIESIGQIGNCEICNKKSVLVYDTAKNSEIAYILEDLIEIYTSEKYLPNNMGKHTTTLKHELVNWGVFSSTDERIVYDIIKNICKDKYLQNPDIFDGAIAIKEKSDNDYIKLNSILEDWDKFANGLKSKIRFHGNYINNDIFSLFLVKAKKLLLKDELYYRGRLSDKQGHSVELIGAPPDCLATGGRMNPEGISFLYLSGDIDTVLHEVRANEYDYVTVGTFQLTQDIEIVDLSMIEALHIASIDDKKVHAINKPILKRICAELIKPVRRQKLNIDYLPTQYISDFINSLGFDGIEFSSALATGKNLTIFKPDLFKCINVDVYEVTNLQYVKKKV